MTEWATNLFAVTLFTDDLTASRRFYESAFGAEWAHEDEESAVFRLGGVLVNLLKTTSAVPLVEPALAGGVGTPCRIQLTVRVSDVDAVCAALDSAGVALLNGPLDRPWGVRTACFEDPSGHNWEIAQPLSTS